MSISSNSQYPSETLFTKNIKQGFEKICLSLVVIGYKSMLMGKEYLKMYSDLENSIDIEEDNFTANMKKNIENTEDYRILHFENHLTIEPQASLYTNEILSLEKSASQSKVIDFKFTGWFKNQYNFYVECKILVEKDWITPKGVKKVAKQLFKRYVETGIDNIVSGYYPKDAAMVAYVLSGSCSDTKNSLNSYIIQISRESEILNDLPPIADHNACYISNHNKQQIKHFFLSLPSK